MTVPAVDSFFRAEGNGFLLMGFQQETTLGKRLPVFC